VTDLKGGVSFEEEFVQKIVGHLIHSSKYNISSNAVDSYLMYSLL